MQPTASLKSQREVENFTKITVNAFYCQLNTTGEILRENFPLNNRKITCISAR
jgi:hypothetical protein